MRAVRARWQGAVLVCGKCSRKVGGGFGAEGRTPLAKALRRGLALGKGRKAALGVVEVKCLGVCPKRAVMMVDAGAPDRWWVVEPGTAMDEVTGLLRPPQAPLGEGDHAQHGGGAAASAVVRAPAPPPPPAAAVPLPEQSSGRTND